MPNDNPTTTIGDGGPAFPSLAYNFGDELGKPSFPVPGMSRRQWLAGMAMQAIIHTNKGDIRVNLFEFQAPKTVRNFTGLAEGTQEWTDRRVNAKDRKSTRLNSSHVALSRMPSSA